MSKSDLEALKKEFDEKILVFRESLRRELEESRKIAREETIQLFREINSSTNISEPRIRLQKDCNSKEHKNNKPTKRSEHVFSRNSPHIEISKFKSLPEINIGASTSNSNTYNTNKNYDSTTNITRNNSIIKLNDYDGLTSWNRYQIHFNIVAENNNWNESEKAAQLASSLRGKAQVVLENLSANELKQIDKITELLDKKFNERQFSRMYYNQLLGLKQKYDQDFSNFAEEIEKLTNLAHYNLPSEARDRIACLQFINGIHNSRIEFTLRSERIESLYEAVERASELLSVTNLVYKNKKEKDMRNSKFNSRFKPYEYTIIKMKKRLIIISKKEIIIIIIIMIKTKQMEEKLIKINPKLFVSNAKNWATMQMIVVKIKIISKIKLTKLFTCKQNLCIHEIKICL